MRITWKGILLMPTRITQWTFIHDCTLQNEHFSRKIWRGSCFTHKSNRTRFNELRKITEHYLSCNWSLVIWHQCFIHSKPSKTIKGSKFARSNSFWNIASIKFMLTLRSIVWYHKQSSCWRYIFVPLRPSERLHNFSTSEM